MWGNSANNVLSGAASRPMEIQSPGVVIGKGVRSRRQEVRRGVGTYEPPVSLSGRCFPGVVFIGWRCPGLTEQTCRTDRADFSLELDFGS